MISSGLITPLWKLPCLGELVREGSSWGSEGSGVCAEGAWARAPEGQVAEGRAEDAPPLPESGAPRPQERGLRKRHSWESLVLFGQLYFDF